jgi:transposase
MIYAQLQTKQQLEHLNEELLKAKKKNWYRRLMIIKLSATEKRSVPQLSKMFDLCPATVRNYLCTYNSGGLKALVPQSPPGRKGKITRLQKPDWDAILEQTPNQYQLLNTDSRQWTLQLMVNYLDKYLKISVSVPAVYYALRRTGRRTGRSKLRVGSPDPDYQVKRQVIEEMTNLPTRGN